MMLDCLIYHVLIYAGVVIAVLAAKRPGREAAFVRDAPN